MSPERLEQPALNGRYGMSYQSMLLIILIAVILTSLWLCLKSIEAVHGLLAAHALSRAEQSDLNHKDHSGIIEALDGVAWAFARCPADPDCRFIAKPRAILRMSSEAEMAEVIREGGPTYRGNRPARDFTPRRPQAP